MTRPDDDNLHARLRRALPAAMKARDRPAVTALRSALAAIDNAGAVDPTQPSSGSRDPDPTAPGTGPPASAGAGTGPPASPDAEADPPASPDAEARPPASPDAEVHPSAAPGAGTGAHEPGGAGTGRPDHAATAAAHPDFAGTVAGVGATEVERRTLGQAEMKAIVRDEIAEREAAAVGYERAGQLEHAERLRAEATVLRSHLDTT